MQRPLAQLPCVACARSVFASLQIFGGGDAQPAAVHMSSDPASGPGTPGGAAVGGVMHCCAAHVRPGLQSPSTAQAVDPAVSPQPPMVAASPAQMPPNETIDRLIFTFSSLLTGMREQARLRVARNLSAGACFAAAPPLRRRSEMGWVNVAQPLFDARDEGRGCTRPTARPLSARAPSTRPRR